MVELASCLSQDVYHTVPIFVSLFSFFFFLSFDGHLFSFAVNFVHFHPLRKVLVQWTALTGSGQLIYYFILKLRSRLQWFSFRLIRDMRQMKQQENGTRWDGHPPAAEERTERKRGIGREGGIKKHLLSFSTK